MQKLIGTISVLYLLLRPKWASPAVLVALCAVWWDQLQGWLVSLFPDSHQAPTPTTTPSTTGSQDSQSDQMDSGEDDDGSNGGSLVNEQALHSQSDLMDSEGDDSESNSGSLVNEQALPGGEYNQPSAPPAYVDIIPEAQPPFFLLPSAPPAPSTAGQRLRAALSNSPATSTRSLPTRVRFRLEPSRSHPQLSLEGQLQLPVFGPSPAPSTGALPQSRGTRTPSLVSVDLGSNIRLNAGSTPGPTPFSTPQGSQRSLTGSSRQARNPPSTLLGPHNLPSEHELDVLGGQTSLTSSWASNINSAAESFSTAAGLASDLQASWRAANTVSRVNINNIFSFAIIMSKFFNVISNFQALDWLGRFMR